MKSFIFCQTHVILITLTAFLTNIQETCQVAMDTKIENGGWAL